MKKIVAITLSSLFLVACGTDIEITTDDAETETPVSVETPTVDETPVSVETPTAGETPVSVETPTIDETFSTETPSLTQISGVWDLTTTPKTDEPVEEEDTIATPYLLISEAGTYSTYVYIEWSESHKANVGTPNCYFHDDQAIQDLGNGSFGTINAQDQSISTSYKIEQGQLVDGDFSYEKTSLQEADLIPLCDEYFD